MCRDPVIEFGLENVTFNTSSVADNPGKEYMTEVSLVFISSLKKLCGSQCSPNANNLTVHITTIAPFAGLKWSTNESYSLNISTYCRKTFYTTF